jgi:hypothetical protein
VRFLGVIAAALLAACSAGANAGESADAVTDVPGSTVRDQKETGNCWLFATTAWAESLERAANAKLQRPSDDLAISVTYLDYWDWFQKIVGGHVYAQTLDGIENDDLDAGGSWGSASELIETYGVVRAHDFNGDGAMTDAKTEGAALKTMATSLLHGALASAAARRDPAIVRRELDRAFGVSAALSAELTATFGIDGKTTLTASSTHVLSSRELAAIAPHPDGTSEVVTLHDVIGERAAPHDNPDHRTGLFAWSDVDFKRGDAAKTRAFFKRIQRALNAGVPLPFGWFFASNADPSNSGVVKTVPAEPADAEDSVGHETVIVDYEVENVPGFGTLHAGTPASDEAKAAALDDSARVTFLRLSDSYGTHFVNGKRVNARDLYVDYLLGKVHVCPKGAAPTSSRCHDEIPLEDVTFPAGF